MCQPIRGQGGYIGFSIDLKSNNTWSGPHNERFVASLVYMSSAVLEKKFKMCQPIKGQGGHIGFWIDLKSNNTWSGPHKEHVWQVWSRSLQPFKM